MRGQIVINWDRRFGLASYELLRIEQYPSVLDFLEIWSLSTTEEE
jgi:hypothetical protein